MGFIFTSGKFSQRRQYCNVKYKRTDAQKTQKLPPHKIFNIYSIAIITLAPGSQRVPFQVTHV